MNKYGTKLRIVMRLCPIVLLTLFLAVSASPQTSPAASQTGTIAPPLFTVTHDATLQGDGTSGFPLGITASPVVSGSLTVNGDIKANTLLGQSATVDDTLTTKFLKAKAIEADARGTSILSAIRSIATDFSQAVEAVGGYSPNTIRGGTGVRAVVVRAITAPAVMRCVLKAAEALMAVQA